ncbi:hypothetical protein JCM8547_001612 [Rhodosporidiobolus lusitaniae]
MSTESAVAAPDPPPSDSAPLPLPASLVSPTSSSPRPPPSDLVIDELSWQHVEVICQQSLASQKVPPSWQDPLIAILKQFEGVLTPDLFAKLAESSLAVAEAGAQIDESRRKHEGDGVERILAGVWGGGGKRTREKSGEKGEEVAREKRRAKWREATMILPHLPPIGGEITAGHGRDTSMDDWTELEDLPKVSIFQLRLETKETTLGAVNSGAASFSLTFSPGEWAGQSLFAEGEPDLDEEDLKLVERFGGTFRLIATSRDAPKLQRILELLLFAVISLHLEVHLLDSLSCPHPPPEPETPTPSEPEEAADDSASAMTGESYEHISSLPASWGRHFGKFATTAGDQVDPRLGSRIRTPFSLGDFHAWRKLMLPHPDLDDTRFHRRRCGKHLASKSSAARSVPNSPTTPTAPDSPSGEFHGSHSGRPGAAKRWKNKMITGFSDVLNLRKQRENSGGSAKSGLSLQKSATIETDTVEVEGKRWLDFSALRIGAGPKGAKEEEEEEGQQAQPFDTPKVSPTASMATTTTTDADKEEKQPLRFEKVVQELASFVLSVSPDVLYPPPHLLFRLRQQELASSETAASSRAFAVEFVDGTADGVQRKVSSQSTAGQSLNAARIPLEVKARLASLFMNNTSLNGSIRHQSMQFLVQTVRNNAPPGTLPCQAPRWVTLPFFQHRPPTSSNPSLAEDSTLAATIKQLVKKQGSLCTTCSVASAEHSLVFAHHKERIEVSLRTVETSVAEKDDDPKNEKKEHDDEHELDHPPILTWTTCKTCRAATEPKALSAAAGSYSFAKFLELVLYDPNLVPLPNLCEHASSDREALVRSFEVQKTIVEIRLSGIALFELRLPTAVDPDVEPDEEDVHSKLPNSTSTEDLKHEIAVFFRDVHVRLDALEDCLVPTPPEDLDNGNESFSSRHARYSSVDTIVETSGSTAKENELPTAKDEDAVLGFLRKLRNFVRSEEADCVSLASEASPSRVNPARHAFETRAKALKNRLTAWEKKHSAALEAGPGPLPPAVPVFEEPEYFGEGVHAYPVESSVLARDTELSSLIALTLGTGAFQEAVASGNATGPSSRVVTPSTLSSFPIDEGPRKPSGHRHLTPSLFLDPSSAAALLSLTPPRTPARRCEDLDPDDPPADFSPLEPEVEVFVKARKAASSGTSRFRLGRQNPHDLIDTVRSAGSPSATPPLEQGGFFDPAAKRISRAAPLSETVLDDLLKTREPTPSTPRPDKPARGVPTFMTHLAQRREGSSLSTLSNVCATATPRADSPAPSAPSAVGTIRSIASVHSMKSTAESSLAASLSSSPSIDDFPLSSTSPSFRSFEENSSHSGEHHDEVAPLPSPASMSASRLIGKSVDVVFSGFESIRSRATGGSSPSLGPPAAVEGGTGASRHPHEHIKLNAKSFRVTAYYARRFQALRGKCGLSESLFIESLSRCTDLNPSGGKSAATFLMTGDKRFMLKELVTKFGASEREVLLNVAPSLLAYLMHPERPSLMAKIFGIFTVKTDENGVKRKVDLVVMENLFFDVSVSRQFDLKGIASRVAKPKSGGEASEGGTGWDSDWIAGSLRDQLLIYPHSKALLRQALELDVDFLSKNGGIDFSLLIGVDDSRSELVVGLIDTIGVFDTRKRLEHAAKTAAKLATASDVAAVTVLPPSEYAERFLSAMERYFVAVPDKWSRPPGEGSVDPLPSLACPL